MRAIAISQDFTARHFMVLKFFEHLFGFGKLFFKRFDQVDYLSQQCNRLMKNGLIWKFSESFVLDLIDLD